MRVAIPFAAANPGIAAPKGIATLAWPDILKITNEII